jgi:lipopolysaccharide transport system ATP-binding protein
MSSPIIRVENLSKKYIVNHRQEGYTTFRDALTNGARSLTQALFNRQESKASSSDEEFWALKDVNFEIQQGDRVQWCWEIHAAQDPQPHYGAD